MTRPIRSGDGAWRATTGAALVVALAGSVAGASAEAAVARTFFVVTVLAGLVAGAGLVGARTQAVMAIVAAALVLGQRVPGHPVADPPSPDWRGTLHLPGDRAEVRMRLDGPEWRAALARAATAWGLVCAEDVGTRPQALRLDLRTDRETVSLPVGAANAVGRARAGESRRYRVPVPLDALRGADAVTVAVALADDGPPLSLCGTHVIRPSWGEPTSVLIRADGVVEPAPSPRGPGRWGIELRLSDADGRVILAWY